MIGHSSEQRPFPGLVPLYWKFMHRVFMTSHLKQLERLCLMTDAEIEDRGFTREELARRLGIEA